MSRLTLLVLIVLLTASPMTSVAGAGAAASPSDSTSVDATTQVAASPSESDNTTRRLRLDAVERRNYSQPTMDFGSTVALTGDQLERGLHFEYLSVRIERASSPQAREALVDAEVEQIQRHIEGLRDQERAAIAAYGSGEISAEQLLRRMGMVHARAEQLDGAITDIETEFGLELGTLHRRTDEYRTPIRNQILAAIEGSRETPLLVHVSGSQQGIVLQSLSESRFTNDYYREGIRLDNYDQDPTDQFNSSSFLEFVGDEYPFIETENGGTFRATGDGSWFYDKSHDQGSIRVYADGSTQAVYREYQSIRVNDLPVETVQNQTDDGTTVTVRRTPNGGPTEVVVSNASSGAPQTTRVYVDGELVGRTAGTGSLWILEPADAYEISVTAQNGPVNVSVSP